MSITVRDLSPDQLEVYESIIGWTRERGPDDTDVLTLGGYAGSGKSTLVSLVAQQLRPPIAFCAYTGKASSVLKRKLAAAGIFTVGVQKSKDGFASVEQRPYCGTIHSLIYRPCACREPMAVTVLKPCPVEDCGTEMRETVGGITCARGHGGVVEREDFAAIKPKTHFVYAEKNADGKCSMCFGKEWLRRETLDRPYSLIIVDEASMVDDTMLKDLRTYTIPILAVGDHGQLPPVGGMGSLMRDPHLRLEKIHRQAEGNPIIALSKMIREQGRIPESLEGDAVVFKRLKQVELLIEERYEQAGPEDLLKMGLACYTNRRRMGLNIAARRSLGFARRGNELPRAGEHVVCLRNMKGTGGAPPIYNGMRGVLTGNAELRKDSDRQIVASVGFPDDDIEARQYEMLLAQFNREKTYGTLEDLAKETGYHSWSAAGALFDFGYAMTVHKMQGSQYEDLVVLVERPGPVGEEDWRRWLYTAVTRASDKLTVLR